MVQLSVAVVFLALTVLAWRSMDRPSRIYSAGFWIVVLLSPEWLDHYYAPLSSMDRYKALSNYHKMSDTPENVDYRTVSQALVISEAVARELARDPWA